MKIKEIMKTDVVTLRPDDNALEAMKLLFKMRISGLPVADTANTLVGMFTEKEIIAHMLPTYLKQVGTFVYAEDSRAVVKKILELKDLRVSQIMRSDVFTVGEDASLCEIAKDMLLQKARRVPIVDSQKKICGIVSRGDILRALAQESGISLAP